MSSLRIILRLNKSDARRNFAGGFYGEFLICSGVVAVTGDAVCNGRKNQPGFFVQCPISLGCFEILRDLTLSSACTHACRYRSFSP